MINQEGIRREAGQFAAVAKLPRYKDDSARPHSCVDERYWEADPNIPRTEDSEFMDPYNAKVKELLIKPQFSFLQDLRNYGVHVSLYPFVLNSQFVGNYMKTTSPSRGMNCSTRTVAGLFPRRSI